MTNYEKYQLQWMIDHNYSLKNLVTELTEMQFCDPEDSDRISTPISKLFDEWIADVGFGSEIWACEEEWVECEEKEEPNSEPKYYKYPLLFRAWLPVTNEQLSEVKLKDMAFTKLDSLPPRFQNCKIGEVRYNFKTPTHFEAEVTGNYELVFCVEGDERVTEIFKESALIFKNCDNGNHIGLYNYYIYEKYFDNVSEQDLLDVLTEITEEEVYRYDV